MTTLRSGWPIALALLGAALLGIGSDRSASTAFGAEWVGLETGWADRWMEEQGVDVPMGAGDGSSIEVVAPGVHAAPPRDDAFGHAAHDGLFPLCTGCHLGAETGDLEALYPEPASCLSCHDGVEQPEVVWEGPRALETHLVFDHGEHAGLNEAAGDSALLCADCHGDPGEAILVDPVLDAGSCLSCHEDPSDDTGHFVEADCASCHLPIARSTLGPERIAAIPSPPDHAVDTFVAKPAGGALHGTLAMAEVDNRCATCHVQDQCALCHVNASRVEEIQSLTPAAPGDLRFPPLGAHYPLPASHEVARFAWNHTGVVGPDAAECSTCHTVESCTACHLQPVPVPIESLVSAETSIAPGTVVTGAPPPSHESVFFNERHGALAAATGGPSGGGSCATCHEAESFCASCHERQAEGGSFYHDPGYSLGHAAEASANVSECSTCHDPVAFCRACHQEAGLQSRGRLGAGYHDAEPLWLLRHPQAARQQLETCTSCHTQNDCLQCHSQTGAFQISPHGPGFDARAAWERNPVVCRACHLSNPFGGDRP